MSEFLMRAPAGYVIPGDEEAVAWVTHRVEHETGITLLEQTWQMTLDAWPESVQLRRPLTMVTVRCYFPPVGMLHMGHRVMRSRPHPVVPRHVDPENGIVWFPDMSALPALRDADGIEITYSAGHSPGAVPSALVAMVERYATEYRRTA